jgi:hypothetical protein
MGRIRRAPAVDEAFFSCMLGLSHRVGAAESADNVGGSSVRHFAGRTRAGPPQAGRMCVHQEPRTVHGSPQEIHGSGHSASAGPSPDWRLCRQCHRDTTTSTAATTSSPSPSDGDRHGSIPCARSQRSYGGRSQAAAIQLSVSDRRAVAGNRGDGVIGHDVGACRDGVEPERPDGRIGSTSGPLPREGGIGRAHGIRQRCPAPTAANTATTSCPRLFDRGSINAGSG